MAALLEVGERSGTFTRAEAKAILDELHTAGKVAGRVQDDVRGAVAQELRKRLLDRHLVPDSEVQQFLDGAIDLAELERRSIERLRKMIGPSGLESADQGALTEQVTRKLKTAELDDLKKKGVIGPEGPPRGKQVELEVNGRVRKIDFVEGDMLVEVKSTTQGLSAEDLVQVRDFADFVKTGKSPKFGPNNEFGVSKLQIVMTDHRGALASVDNLLDLLAKPNVQVNLFNASGESMLFNKANAGEIRKFLAK